ncbi:MAG: hypothetical protein AAGA90_19410 [Actinomycetota bacterium]
MQIRGWTDHGVSVTIGGVRASTEDAAALRAAIAEARGTRTDETVLWSQPRSGAGVRNAARLVLGLGSTVAVGLLMALVVVGSGARAGVLIALVVLVVVGGGFVARVWATDVGVEIRADGRLTRAGWGGIESHDLRAFRRVTVTGGGVDTDEG